MNHQGPEVSDRFNKACIVGAGAIGGWLGAGLARAGCTVSMLARGQTLLIHSVGSGVGTAAVQLARAWGVTSIGTSRTEEKLTRCAELLS